MPGNLGDVVVLEFEVPAKLAALSQWIRWLVAVFLIFGIGGSLVLRILFGGIGETREIVSLWIRLSGYGLFLSAPFTLAWAIEIGTDNYRRRVAKLAFNHCRTAAFLLFGMAGLLAGGVLGGIMPVMGYVFADDHFIGEFLVVEKDGLGILVSHINKESREEVAVRSPGVFFKRDVGDEVCIAGRRWMPGIVIIDRYDFVPEMERNGAECNSQKKKRPDVRG